MIELFEKARKVSTPLIAITTPDQSVTIATILGSQKDAPVFVWDSVSGMKPVNEKARDGAYNIDDDTQSPVAAMQVFLDNVNDGQKEILIIKNGHMGLNVRENWTYIQMISNMREPLKANNRTLILLAPDIKVPIELSNDILILDEPLPDANQLSGIITQLMAAVPGQTAPPSEDLVRRSVDATLSLNAF